ncbi:6453_t:CDS:1, partial [Gigaspora rosea]
ISITKNASLIIQLVCPSLDNLNLAIREFHALTKAGIPKNKLAFIINCVNSNAKKKYLRIFNQSKIFCFPIAFLDKISNHEAQKL